jgi:hypothetical protein
VSPRIAASAISLFTGAALRDATTTVMRQRLKACSYVPTKGCSDVRARLHSASSRPVLSPSES